MSVLIVFEDAYHRSELEINDKSISPVLAYSNEHVSPESMLITPKMGYSAYAQRYIGLIFDQFLENPLGVYIVNPEFVIEECLYDDFIKILFERKKEIEVNSNERTVLIKTTSKTFINHLTNLINDNIISNKIFFTCNKKMYSSDKIVDFRLENDIA